MSERLQIEAFENVQHLQRGDALRVRRELEHVVAAIGRGDRIEPVRRVSAEVRFGQQPVAAFHVLGDRPRDRTAVERVAATLRDRLQRCRQPRIREDLAGRRRPAARKERSRRGGVARQRGLGTLPLHGNDLAHREAIPRISDRRLQRLCERDRAVLREQLAPAVHDAGDAHGQLSTVRDVVELAPPELVRRRGRRGAAARVQCAYGAGLRIVNQREQVAAQPVHRRFDDGQDGRGRDRRVDRVASLLEHPQPGGRRQRLAGCDEAVPGHHDRACGARVRGRTIAGQLAARKHVVMMKRRRTAEAAILDMCSPPGLKIDDTAGAEGGPDSDQLVDV